MTCPKCGRADVALVGGMCGVCESTVCGGVKKALEEAGLGSDDSGLW